MMQFLRAVFGVASLVGPAFSASLMARDDPYYASLDHSPRLGLFFNREPEIRDSTRCMVVIRVAGQGFGENIPVGSCVSRIGDLPSSTPAELVAAGSRLRLDTQVRVYYLDSAGERSSWLGYPVPAFVNDDSLPRATLRCRSAYFIRMLDHRINRALMPVMTPGERRAHDEAAAREYAVIRDAMAADNCPHLDLP